MITSISATSANSLRILEQSGKGKRQRNLFIYIYRKYGKNVVADAKAMLESLGFSISDNGASARMDDVREDSGALRKTGTTSVSEKTGVTGEDWEHVLGSLGRDEVIGTEKADNDARRKSQLQCHTERWCRYVIQVAAALELIATSAEKVVEIRAMLPKADWEDDVTKSLLEMVRKIANNPQSEKNPVLAPLLPEIRRIAEKPAVVQPIVARVRGGCSPFHRGQQSI